MILSYPQDLDLHSITDRLSNVEPSIKFTYELDSLFSLFKGILTFVGYLMSKSFSKKNSNGAI